MVGFFLFFIRARKLLLYECHLIPLVHLGCVLLLVHGSEDLATDIIIDMMHSDFTSLRGLGGGDVIFVIPSGGVLAADLTSNVEDLEFAFKLGASISSAFHARIFM